VVVHQQDADGSDCHVTVPLDPEECVPPVTLEM
jgi:hypothetical protein